MVAEGPGHILLDVHAGCRLEAASCSCRCEPASSAARRLADPRSRSGSRRAALVLTMISPVVVRSSSSKTRVGALAGDEQLPVGLRGEKTMDRSERRPTCSSTGPTELSCPPISSIDHCMSDAAPAARSAWRSPRKRRRRASPRNLSTSPPCRSATAIRSSNTDEIRCTSSSAPAFPFTASRSARAVNPEMSIETSVASTSTRARRLGLLAPEAHEPREVGAQHG